MKVLRAIVVITLIEFSNAHYVKQIIADSPASLADISNIINSASGGGEVITVEVEEVDGAFNIPAKQQLIPVNFGRRHPPPQAGHAPQWMQAASNSQSHRSYANHHHNKFVNSVMHRHPHGSDTNGGGYWGSSSYGLANNAPQLTGPSYAIVIVEETPSQKEHKSGQNSYYNEATRGNNRPENIHNVYSDGLPNTNQQPNIYGQQDPNRHQNHWQQQPNYGHQQTNYVKQQLNYEQQPPTQDDRRPTDENQKPNQHSNKHQHNDGPEINSTRRPLRENNVNQADTDSIEANEFSIDIRTGFDEDYTKPV